MAEISRSLNEYNFPVKKKVNTVFKLDIGENESIKDRDISSAKNCKNMYCNSLEHLLAELSRIDTIVRFHVKKKRAKQTGDMDDFLGLIVSDDEVDYILQTQPFRYGRPAETVIELNNIEAITREINTKKSESIDNGIKLQLNALEELFYLTPFDLDVLLLCLAVELDLSYEKLYSYLQNDVTRKLPTVDLAIKLFCASLEESFSARDHFSPSSPLFENKLIYFTGDRHEDQIPLLSKSIKIDERIIGHLLESNDIDQRIRDYSVLIKPEKSFEDLILPEVIINRIRELIKRYSRKETLLFYFNGPYGAGKRAAAEAVCGEMGLHLLVVDAQALLVEDSNEMLKLILRECLLQDSLLYIEGFDRLFQHEKSGEKMGGWLETLDQFPKWIFLSGEQPWEPPGIIKNHSIQNVPFNLPSYIYRKKLWDFFLDDNIALSEDVNTAALASKFKFTGGQMKEAIFTACNNATAKNAEKFELSMADLTRGCKARSNKNLSKFAKKIEPHYTWKDIVLPEDLKEQLKEICGYIRHKGIVYSDWGFDKKLSLGKGLNALFSGPSGTGKTMAAEVIANEVGLDIYKIDLSGVVSKYIGETEKNLGRIFSEAETSNAILFFDEADALFGKRSEVKDSHDRYANIEINYLLQRMEEYEGIVILASNYIQNIDEAFQRRMHFKVDFPLPDRELREKIWRKIFPEETPINIPQVNLSDIKDAVQLACKLCDANNPLSRYFQENLTLDLRKCIDKLNYNDDTQIRNFTKVLADELNRLINECQLNDEQYFANVLLKPETKKLSKKNPEGKDRIRLNRLLLEEAYPNEIAQSFIDFDFLSQLKFAGGNIKNIALSSAFLAAGEASAIRMEHILRATRREFQKIGKLCMAEDFGNYYNMLEVHKR